MTKKIVLFIGGVSCEHEVSIVSGRNIYKALKAGRLGGQIDILIVLINKNGTWSIISESELDAIPKYSTIDYSKTKPYAFIFKCDNEAKLGYIHQTQIVTQFTISCAIIMIHGTMGEDGALQGLLEVMGVLYVGSKISSSSICMDKILTKLILTYLKIKNTPFIYFNKNDEFINYDTAKEELQSNTLFVKPSNLGSSVGVAKVSNEEEYKIAIESVFSISNYALIEKAMKGREIECSVLELHNPHSLFVSITGEISITKPGHFYTYEAKYLGQDSPDLLIPSTLTKEIEDKVRAIAQQVFTALKCSDLARIDFFVNEENDIFVNEINTLPGFTEISMYPSLLESSGIPYQELIALLVERYI